MNGVEFDPYQGRRRAYARGPGDRWLLTGLVMLALVALVIIVINGPQRARSAPTALPGTVGGAVGAAPSMVDASPTEPASPSPSPSAAPTDPAARVAAASPVWHRPAPAPTVAHASPAPWQASYEAEAGDHVARWHMWVAPMTGASGGLGAFGLGRPTMGALWFSVTVPASGSYQLTVYYQNPDGTARFAFIRVNRGGPLSTGFAPTGSGAVRSVSVLTVLDAGGGNTIWLGNPYGRGPDIDRIVLTRSS